MHFDNKIWDYIATLFISIFYSIAFFDVMLQDVDVIIVFFLKTVECVSWKGLSKTM